eukprot:m.14067 g.14067  ORF g.14067 m.14067 type:complete len:86 (-) comp8278_c0_seq1:59-316(-)
MICGSLSAACGVTPPPARTGAWSSPNTIAFVLLNILDCFVTDTQQNLARSNRIESLLLQLPILFSSGRRSVQCVPALVHTVCAHV